LSSCGERLTPFQPPLRETKGFGTQLIDRTLGGALGAKIERVFIRTVWNAASKCRSPKILPETKADPAVAPEQLPV
jgi:hypothetical protein